MITMDGEYEIFHHGILRQVTKIGLYLYYTTLYFSHQVGSYDLDSGSKNCNISPDYEVQREKLLFCTKTFISLYLRNVHVEERGWSPVERGKLKKIIRK